MLSNEAAVAAMRNVFSNSSKSAADVAGDMLDIALRRGTVNWPCRLHLFERHFPKTCTFFTRTFSSACILTLQSNYEYGRFERQYQCRSSSIALLAAK